MRLDLMRFIDARKPRLCEPESLRQAALRVLSYPSCPSPRELAKERRKAFEEAETAPARALASTGLDDPAERQLAGGGIRAVKGKVGMIAVHGPIDQHYSSELMKAGGTCCDQISRALDALLASADVGAIVLHVDSPGGNSYGVSELSEKIFNARAQKPIYACADSMAASAAFWLATSASTFVATPGGDVGSVGVYCMHVDQSAALEQEGLKVTLVKAGEYKAELAGIAPLTEAARANLQDSVDYTYDQFVDGLARNRDTTAAKVKASFGKGRLVNPEQAVKAGMCDRVMTFEQLMQKLTGTAPGSQNARAASAEVLRLQHEQRKRATEALRQHAVRG